MFTHFYFLFTITFLIFLSTIPLSLAVEPENHVVSMVYVGEKGDSSYLEGAFEGLNKTQEKFKFSVRDIPWNASAPVDPVTDENQVRSDAVIIMGAIMNGYEKNIISDYPDVPVIIIDGDQNSGFDLKSISFCMYGTSYLAGVLAANQTKTGKIGVIAGVDAPVIRGFTDGFIDGAKEENPEVIINISYIADDYSGFSMPDRAANLTRDMYRSGTDIIYQVAGASGLGVIDIAKTLPGIYVIGTDVDQSGIASDTVIASAIKRLDSVVYTELEDVYTGSFIPGSIITGLEKNGASLILNPRFENNSIVIENRKEEAIKKENEYLKSHSIN